MQLQTSDVTVQRLHLRGRGIRQANVTQALDGTRWPHTENGEWLFIRKLQVSSPLDALDQQVSAQAQLLAAQAVDGKSYSAANADAVRFSSLHVLLVQLSVALAQGGASRYWYWQQWSRLFHLPVATALYSLWAEYIEYLPAVIDTLQSDQQLEIVWRELDSPTAQQLLHRLEQVTSTPFTRIMMMSPAQSALPKLPTALLQALPVIQQSWSPVVARLPVADPRRLLAAALVAIRHAPMHLATQPESVLWQLSVQLHNGKQPKEVAVQDASSLWEHSVVHQGIVDRHVTRHEVTFDDGVMESTVSRRTDDGTQSNPLAHLKIHEPAAVSTGKIPENTDSLPAVAEFADARITTEIDGNVVQESMIPSRPTGETGDENIDVGHTSTKSPLSSTHEERGESEQPDKNLHHSSTSAEPITDQWAQQPPPLDGADKVVPCVAEHPYEGECYTGQGGIFYLINFINRPEVQKFIAAHGGMTQCERGWEWLYFCARLFELQPETQLNQLFAHWMDCEADELGRLPVLPFANEIMKLGSELYKDHGVWNADLLYTSAHILYTPSHVDVIYPLDAAHLSVRLAGLDINPGWVPWLGKVVTFHYRNGDSSVEKNS